ncbi:MAG: hypothetical protein IT382_20490 [Deltaproteobacteria bacterium]|nr:hypothetical protein [Deltaproteobacteria bacterium]
MVTPLRLAARLDFATLDELEAGFAERLGERALFLAHGSLGDATEEPRVGTAVSLDICTAHGEVALQLEGVVAWSYPAAAVPPGREAGTGIQIDHFLSESAARVDRIRRRVGAGTRVRIPGMRLKPPPVEPARPSPAVSRPLPASLFEVSAARPLTTAPDAQRSVPAPRLMGLTFDAPLAPARPSSILQEARLDAPPLAGTRGGPPPGASESPLEALPDLPSAAPATAFEQVPTDVDLLRSVGDADLLSGDAGRVGFEHRALVDVTGPRLAVLPPESADAAPRGAGDGVLSDAALLEPEEVSDADVSPVDEDSTGSHGVQSSALPSLEAAEFETAEHQAVPQAVSLPNAADWEGRPEHGLDPSEPTAEASDPDRTVLPHRPLPDPSGWPSQEDPASKPIGVAFVVARKAPEPVGLEVLSWPDQGTKRVGALDEARAQGGERLDEALASAHWLARDPSAPSPADHDTQSFDAGLTDPGRLVVDLVGEQVRAAEGEPDGGDVFSDAGRSPRAGVNPALEEATVAEEAPPAALPVDGPGAGGDATLDAGVDDVRGAVPLLADEDLETDRDLPRPPTHASADTRNRLSVLQRFLGKR